MGVKATHPKYTCTNCLYGKTETDVCKDCRVMDVDTLRPRYWKTMEAKQCQKLSISPDKDLED